MNCIKSPCGEHQYNPSNYGRDDQAFYLDCVHCGYTSIFQCDTEDEFYALFDMGDDGDDYDYSNLEDDDREDDN